MVISLAISGSAWTEPAKNTMACNCLQLYVAALLFSHWVKRDQITMIIMQLKWADSNNNFMFSALHHMGHISPYQKQICLTYVAYSQFHLYEVAIVYGVVSFLHIASTCLNATMMYCSINLINISVFRQRQSTWSRHQQLISNPDSGCQSLCHTVISSHPTVNFSTVSSSHLS